MGLRYQKVCAANIGFIAREEVQEESGRSKEFAVGTRFTEGEQYRKQRWGSHKELRSTLQKLEFNRK